MARKSRSSRNEKKPRRRIRWWRLLLVVVVVVALVGAGLGAGFVLSAVRAMPEIADVRPEAQITSYVYDVHGEQVAPLHGPEHRIMVEHAEIPDVVREAFMAIEDHRFYDHFGLDLYRIVGAAWNNLTGGPLQGGSTISQQLARNAWPIGMEQTWTRKIQEAVLALQLERAYTKDQILTMYLNQINLGHGAYGVQAAAEIYFDKDVADLDLAQAALLAALPRAPSVYSPYVNPDLASQRRSVVLANMVREGFIDEDQKEQAQKQPIELAGLENRQEAVAPHFIDYVLSQLLERYPSDVIYGGGLKVHTTLDPEIQTAAEESVKTHLLEDFPQGAYDKDLQIGMVIADPHTGHIKAMIGGRQHTSMLEQNRAWQTYRQPGSAFKPIAVYTPALEEGWTPATVIDDSPVDVRIEETGQRFTPRNYSESGWPLGAYRGLTTMREAIRRSVNVTAVRALMDLGIDKGLDAAERMGFSKLITSGPQSDRGPSLALGGLTEGASPLEMTLAYSAFAAGGVKPEPIAITKIVDRHGNVLEENSPQRSVVTSPEAAYLMTDMLRSVVSDRRSGWESNWGTGDRARFSAEWPIAGKTGTTDDIKDLWWIGYTPEYVGTVWLGFDQPEDIAKVVGRSMPSGLYPVLIWRDAMEPIHEGLEITDFERPDGMVEKTVCIKSGKLPGEHCPTNKQRRELFHEDNVPTEKCETHVELEVCSEHPNLLWDGRCPAGGRPTKEVFLDRPPVDEPVVDTQGRTLPKPWDLADLPPTESCQEVHGPAEEPADMVEITMSDTGISPVIVRVGEGQEVTLRVTAEDAERELVIQGQGIELEVAADETAEIIFTPEQVGIYRMYCGKSYPENSNLQGRFIVERR